MVKLRADTTHRRSGTITVSGGAGSVNLNQINVLSTFAGIKGPSSTSTYSIRIIDTQTGVQLAYFKSRSGDLGFASSKVISIPYISISLQISEANEDGDYTYLIT